MPKFQYTGKVLGYNQRYAFRTAKKLSPEYEQFLYDIGWEFKRQNVGFKPFVGKVEVSIFFNTAHDTDNISKAIFDGLEGILFLNDRQVDDLRVKRVKDIPHGFVLYCQELPAR